MIGMDDADVTLGAVLSRLSLAAIAKPGDVVVLEAGRRLTAAEHEQISAVLERVKKDSDVRFVLLDGDLRVAQLGREA